MDRRELNETLRLLARKYAEIARETLGDDLVSVVLFGSVARGEATPTSDIDILLVVRGLPAKGAFKRRAVIEPVRERITEDLESLWQKGVYVDFVEVLYTPEEAQVVRPIYLDMTEEAVLLYDKEGFFEGILKRLRERLREIGAQRKTLGKIRYWDLTPDGTPREVVL